MVFDNCRVNWDLLLLQLLLSAVLTADLLCVEIYVFNVRFCWDFVDGLYAEIYGYKVWFVGILLSDCVLKFMDSMCVFGWNFVEGLCVYVLISMCVLVLELMCLSAGIHVVMC